MSGVAAADESFDYLAANRAFWEGLAPDVGAHGDQVAHGRQRWAEPAPVWGDWSVPESELRLLPDDVAGLDVLELGCGTGYVSAWLARLGARPVGSTWPPGSCGSPGRCSASTACRSRWCRRTPSGRRWPTAGSTC